MTIYAFEIVEATETIDLDSNQQLAEPLWKLPFDGSRIHYGSLSDGFSDIFATYFVASTDDCVCSLVIPHGRNEEPRISVLICFGGSKCPMFSLGFGKAFIQHRNGAITRLSYSWYLEAGEIKASPSSASTVILQEYPTTYDRSRPPMLDGETGRIVECTRQHILIIDTALYLNQETL